ncbi:MAG TPA: hypothetical protein VFV27_06335 [Nevskiaceae bacterium]|nr:hypothetical protein [Nevskiaceae bacterium]
MSESRRLAALWLLALSLTVALILLLPRNPGGRLAPVVPESYPALPSLPERSSGEADVQLLLLSDLWGQRETTLAVTDEAAGATAGWRLLGVYGFGGRRYALIQRDDGSVGKLGNGEALPDGRTILTIDRHRVQVGDPQGQRVWIPVNRPS